MIITGTKQKPTNLLTMLTKNVTILYTNINSLRNKVQNLEWESKQFSNIDVISLTETSLGPEINTGEVEIEGYELLRNDRSEICVKIKSKKKKQKNRMHYKY